MKIGLTEARIQVIIVNYYYVYIIASRISYYLRHTCLLCARCDFIKFFSTDVICFVYAASG